ncbi:hypothetical protein TWF192_004048 [Orbilia oligospora]|uniref:Uncharacterized protein n=1 Tax=Orbilia oligospora TaxID=2813651 RepID=A0A6G1MN35_ORBOL|nr:hypothetical protein TWF191_000780 [Orbilia oligospora]KAF3264360.1 hypothetical protein TWF192_004048 [Orbilia oligospora]
MPSVFSCFGRIFKRRKNMKISSPMETTPEGPRPARNTSKHPLSVKTPNLSTFGAQTTPGPRSPNLVYSNNNSRGSVISRRPNVTNSNPTISVTTPGATSFPLTSPQVPNFFTKSSSSSSSQEDVYLTDEKKNSSSSEFPRTPGTFDFDATPRIHRIFKMLSPPPTKLTFTEAVRPEPVIVEPKKSMASRISKRLSRRWTSKNMNFNTSNTNISITSSPKPRDLGTPRSIPEMCYSPQYIPGVSYESSLPSSPRVYTTPLSPPPIPSLPLSARNGLGQCLTTRLPNGEVKPVTMVPQLKLSVPIFSRVQTLEATPIEASPVCDPWRHRREEIEGMSDRHQAWLL